MSEQALLVKNQLGFRTENGTTGAIFHNKGVKYGDKAIFTFDEDKIYSAYGKPYLTLGYQIKNDL